MRNSQVFVLSWLGCSKYRQIRNFWGTLSVLRALGLGDGAEQPLSALECCCASGSSWSRDELIWMAIRPSVHFSCPGEVQMAPGGLRARGNVSLGHRMGSELTVCVNMFRAEQLLTWSGLSLKFSLPLTSVTLGLCFPSAASGLNLSVPWSCSSCFTPPGSASCAGSCKGVQGTRTSDVHRALMHRWLFSSPALCLNWPDTPSNQTQPSQLFRW